MPPQGARTAERASTGIAYEVAFELTGDIRALRQRLAEVSATLRDRDRPPANRLLLRRRAEDDRARLLRLLRAEGYYAARVEVVLEPPRDAGGRWRVIFRIDGGPRYRLGRITLALAEASPPFRLPAPARLGLEPGAPARAARVLAAERRLVELARSRGHAFARAGKRRVVVDHARRTMDVRLVLQPGPKVRFARPHITGLEGSIDETWVRRRLGIREGEPFSPERLARARERLLETGLFALVRLRLGSRPDAAGRVPLLVELAPRKFRSLGGAVGFRTDEGPRLRAFWEHRNLLRRGERLRLELQAARPRSKLAVDFTRPDVGRLGRDLGTTLELRRERADTYTSRSLTLGLRLREPLTRRLQASLGLRYREVRLRERNRHEASGLLALPLGLAGDYADDLLDPRRGLRLDLAIEPTVDLRDPALRFVRLRAQQRLYLPLARRPHTTLALRLVAGSLLGAPRDRVPADERFYAGGGGSVRGIPLHRAGPLVDRHEPLGGRSLLEAAAELRVGLSRRLQFAAFLDAGSVFTAMVPDLAERGLRMGAGLGVRYLTPVGPVRLDVAVPLDRDPAVDDPFQIYIGIGQPF